MYRVDCSRYAMSRPHSSTLVRMFDAPSQARCTPPSWATESSPYSLNTRSYSRSARAVPMDGAACVSPTCSRNSSRNSRRSDLAEREYRAKSAPFTTSGRLTSAKTGPSRFVKYGPRTRRSSAVKRSTSVLPAEVGIPAGEHVLARRREHVDHLRVLGKVRGVRRVARDHGDVAGHARPLLAGEREFHLPRQDPEDLLVGMLVRGGVGAGFHVPEDHHLLLAHEDPARDL